MNEIVEMISRLLDSMDGIELVSAVSNVDLFRIEFTIADAYSRLIVLDMAEISNVPLNVYARHPPYSSEGKSDPDHALLYCFYSSRNDDPEDQACWLGAHLTWSLHKVGLIDAAAERQYCKIFGAESRSG